ncbi:MAG: HU family DNA-binding protein [Desulfomonilaceae bacterium]|nr:HU family DNA-binding protein [Desulfomonilaceae bacterium]
MRKPNREIGGFGFIEVREHHGSAGGNPMTGKRIRVEDKRFSSFKAGKDLRTTVDHA